MSSALPDFDAVVVGAGFSGIGTAIKLDRAQLGDYLVIEAGDGVGGTWHWNTYPGIAVDIPSFSSSFRSSSGRTGRGPTHPAKSSSPMPSTASTTTASVARSGSTPRFGRGFRRRAGAVADPNRTRRRNRGQVPGERQRRAHRPQAARHRRRRLVRWCHHAHCALGSRPGPGKRVAVIGTGASAVQIIPEIAPIVDELTVFQRTPIWCFPKFDVPLPAVARWAMRLPGARIRSLTRFWDEQRLQAYEGISIPGFPTCSCSASSDRTAMSGHRISRSSRRRPTTSCGA